MLFDPRPKRSIDELFDRREEFEALFSADEPLTLLLGIRRVGKSSLLRATLNEIEGGVYIDARKMYFDSGGWITADSLRRELERALNSLRKDFRSILIEAMKTINGVKVKGIELRFEKSIQISDVLEALNEVGAVIGVDEAQYLRFYGSRGGREFLALLAYAYDNLENLRFILTGSEVGLLHDFLGLGEYESPLYGRSYGEVRLMPFSRSLSIEFLKRGFAEAGVEVPMMDIERAVDVLDGIPGWLVDFGRAYMKEGNLKSAIESVLKKAEGFLRGELKELERRSPRYILILEGIAKGYNRWELLREYLAVKGQEVPKSRLSKLLDSLEKMSWIIRESVDGRRKYRIVDPVIERVLKESG
nr:ATP-binding protein [Thermococcus sp.]